MKLLFNNHLKNLIGWRTNRKIVVFSIDDYGNVRLNSKKARENLDKAGLKVLSSFNAYNSIETKEDNRNKNLKLLEKLLTKVLKKWPDVEFSTSVKLLNLITQ